ncbi:MAG: hypothetical protein KF681_11245 [Bdellovibrionaceae bacterium]|nr:hypothetical protein [Pseudobdellovibrionaceae bacterium]
MKTLWVRALLPVLVVSMVVACGKKDDGDSKPRTTPRSQVPNQAPRQEPGQSRQQTETVDPRQTQPQTEPAAPQVPPKEGEDSQGPGLPGGAEPAPIPTEPGQTPPRNQNAPPRQTPGQQAPGQEQQGPGLPGSQVPPRETLPPTSQEDFITSYTGAGDDYLRGYLTQKMNSVRDDSVRSRNQAAANSVRGVRTRIDRETGDVLVSVVRDKGGRTETVVLGGTLSAEGTTALIAQNNSGVKGSLVCLDRNVRTCFVASIRLEIGRPGSKAVVRVISRKTNANFDWRFPRSFNQANREFNRLVEMFANTERKNGQRNSLRRVLVETFEIINGRSGVKMSLVSNENEVIVGSGPLLGAQGGGIVTNVEFGRDPHIEDLVDYENGRDFKSNMHDSISDFRMIGNDGKKEITILFTVRPAVGGQEENLRVTFIRTHLGIMTSQQLERLESSLAQ